MAIRIRPAPTLAFALVAAGTLSVPAAERADRRDPQVVVANPQPAQGAPEQVVGTGMVSGVVIDAGTGQPIPSAIVHIGLYGRSRLGQQSRQVTDSRGRFVFVEVPASERLVVMASRPGYLPGGYHQEERYGGSGGAVTIADGEWIGGLRIKLSKLGSIGGTVLDEQGEPVVGVHVRLLAVVPIAGRDRLAAGPSTLTDDRGAYRITGLLPRRYLVVVPSVQASVPAAATTAEIAGYTEERLASARSRGTTPRIPVERAVASGPGARVVIGPYPIPPPPVDGRTLTYPMAFHPAATTVQQAVPVDLRLGEQRAQVDVRLTPLPGVEVSGRVEGPPTAVAHLTLRLLATGFEELGLGSETATALTAADGTFRFANVPAGMYTIEAPVSVNEYRFSQLLPFSPMIGRPPGVSGTGSWSDDVSVGPMGTSFISTTLDGERSMSAQVEISIGDADLAGVVVPLRGTATISGHVRLDLDPNRPQPATLPGMQVSAEPADGSSRLGLARGNTDRNDPARPFTIAGLLPGRYLLRAPSAGGWRIKSISFGGRDYTYEPFDTTTATRLDGVAITVTNAVAAIHGTVRDSLSAPAAGARVVAFPVERGQWTQFGLHPPRLRSAVTSNLGAYRIEPLPAGSYYVVAIPDPSREEWRHPAFLERAVASASVVTVGWGETRTQDVVAVEVR